MPWDSVTQTTKTSRWIWCCGEYVDQQVTAKIGKQQFVYLLRLCLTYVNSWCLFKIFCSVKVDSLEADGKWGRVRTPAIRSYLHISVTMVLLTGSFSVQTRFHSISHIFLYTSKSWPMISRAKQHILYAGKSESGLRSHKWCRQNPLLLLMRSTPPGGNCCGSWPPDVSNSSPPSTCRQIILA